MKSLNKSTLATACALATTCISAGVSASEQPNILVIFGDDIGYSNLSTYNQGMLGYKTPNIDRIATEGTKFTEFYAQQSSTAGRSAFITGQMPKRTGLSKVGMPGAKEGISAEDPTLATMLKEYGYATAQFGKNHLGDRDEFLPTAHGFDEFFGNLYHLNAEEEPENSDFPQEASFTEKYAPRGVIRSTVDGKIEDSGPLTRKRMETVDQEFLAAAEDFIERQVADEKPFFTWVNTSRMHNFTHVGEENSGRTGLGFYADGMVEHDEQVGQLLDKVEELGITDNTIIIYTTDNGPMKGTWPDAASSPFRGEKNTGWEGGFRVPALMSWPGKIPANTTVNGMMALEDFVPTLVSAAGNSNIKEELLEGRELNGKEYKVHLDGFDQTAMIQGKTEDSARNRFYYWSDDGDLLAVRHDRWKFHFMIQEHNTGIEMWKQPFTTLRVPLIFDLAIDPFEAGDLGIGYDQWMYERLYLMGYAKEAVADVMETFKEFPPRFEAGSFTPKTQ
ncbi:arylsulfatase [Vibrio tasmaniensis]|uniref:arylsulfatase n=1 Tax=Vibrio tasmaniensis TaxID=212663 RepID=UPI001119A07F